MRLPLPKNRLVALTLFGVVATALVTAAVVTPGALGDQTGGADTTTSPSADAPQPNQQFTPAVDDGGHGEGDEYEHDEEYEHGEDYEHEEREGDDEHGEDREDDE